LNQIRADVSPVGPIEELLADRVVNIMWRLERLARAETALFDWRVRILKVGQLADQVRAYEVPYPTFPVHITDKAAHTEATEARARAYTRAGPGQAPPRARARRRRQRQHTTSAGLPSLVEARVRSSAISAKSAVVSPPSMWYSRGFSAPGGRVAMSHDETLSSMATWMVVSDGMMAGSPIWLRMLASLNSQPGRCPPS
jgi:hypothetical protein